MVDCSYVIMMAGPGKSNLRPSAPKPGDAVMGRNEKQPPSWFFRQKLGTAIQAFGGQNMSGANWENEHAGLRNEGVNPAGQGSMGNSKPSS